MASLPSCDYRVVFEEGFYCRHALVRSERHAVNEDICRACAARLEPCDPRPIPSEFPSGVPPALLTRAARWTRAILGHKLAGGEFRSAERIEEIRITHCQACPFYDSFTCTHSACGCSIGSAAGLFNKLAVATETCPDGRWE